MLEPLRRWRITIEDENGDMHTLQDKATHNDWEFVGTFSEVCAAAQPLVDHWEEQTGALCLRMTAESMGKIE